VAETSIYVHVKRIIKKIHTQIGIYHSQRATFMEESQIRSWPKDTDRNISWGYTQDSASAKTYYFPLMWWICRLQKL